MARGIKDQVAIIGMGCSRFGERWADGADDLMHEAFAGSETSRREAVEDVLWALLNTKEFIVNH